MADPNSPFVRFRLWRNALPPALRLLLTLNIALYGIWVVLMVFRLGEVFIWLTLNPLPGEVLTRPWTPVTYTFANLFPSFFGLISFAFAMLWLNWMGRDYEDQFGSHRLFGLYMLAGLFGAAVGIALATWGIGHAVYFGAWGPVTAVLCALATLQPNRGIGLFLLGVIPLKWIAIGFVVLDLAFVQDPTHLAMALFGFAFAKAQQGDVDLAAWARPLFTEQRSGYAVYDTGPSMGERMKGWFTREDEDDEPEAPRSRPARRSAPRRAPQPRTDPSSEVDRILDKILEQGFESLTDEEKRVLDDASRRS